MPPRKKKPAAGSVGLGPADVAATDAPREVAALGERVAAAGGQVLSSYRDPLGGHWVVFAVLPLEQVTPTPFQRELSDAHVKRLTDVIPKVGRFLDPIVAVATDDGGAAFMSPNGMHRLEAMKRLGGTSITALIVPDREIAYRILALNTEKAHNLKDKALEVVRMADQLAGDKDLGGEPESTWAFEFEEPAYLTIGRVYLERPRYAGGAYMPVVKRCEAFGDQPIKKMVALRAKRAAKLIELDDAVAGCVEKLKQAGLTSPYLKPFVVARLNPLRFVPRGKGKGGGNGKGDGDAAVGPADFDATIGKMLERAAKFDAGKVKPSDLAGSAYASAGGGDED